MSRRPPCMTLAAVVFLSLSINVAKANNLTPDEAEQVKLKSAKWMARRLQADALIKEAKYQAAETIVKETLADRQELKLDLLSEYDELGDLYLKWGKKEEAEKAFKDMVEAREKLDGADDPLLAYPMDKYAQCLEKNGKVAEAKKIRARAAAIQKEAQTIPKFRKITAAPGSQARLAEAEKMTAKAEKCDRNDDSAKALVYYERAIALNPGEVAALRGRAQIEFLRDQFAKALKDFAEAIKLKPGDAKTYYERALLYEGRNNNSLALADFTKAVELDPKDTETMGYRAKLLNEMGKHKEAVEGYSKLISVDPTLYWPYIQRADAYLDMGQHKKAIADYTTLVDRAPDDGDFHELRGAAYFQDGDLQKAVEDYNKVIELNPKYSKGYHERAKVYEKVDGKKTDRVVADYAEAKKLGYR